MDVNESVPSDVCRRFVEVLATRKQPLRVVRNALARAIDREGELAPKALHEALGAACVVALSAGFQPAFIDDETLARAPRLRATEALVADAIRALEVLAHAEKWHEDVQALRALFAARAGTEAPASEVLPLFASIRPSSLPAPPASAPLLPEPSTASPLQVEETLSACPFVLGPLDDEDVVIQLVSSLTVHPLDDVLDEVFAPIFADARTTSAQARAAYALSAMLAIAVGRLPPKIVPRALAALVPVTRKNVARGELSFAASVLERLESVESPLRLDAPDADIRGRVRLRIRALRRVLLAER